MMLICKVEGKRNSSGFTLIELLIVIAIIGILASVAVPYYQGYMVRAKLVEVEHTMATVESAVSNYRIEKETSWPDCPTISEIKNSLGVGLESVKRISEISVDGNSGTITATVTGIHPMVDGKWVALTPTLSPNGDGSFSWGWGWSTDFPVHLRPKTR